MEKFIFFTVLMLAAQFGLSMRIRAPMTVIAVDEPVTKASLRSEMKSSEELDSNAGPYEEKDRNRSPGTRPVRFMELDCTSPIDIANCEAASVDPFIKKWAYQPKRGYCQPFLKGACGGNNNAYETESMCLETCAHNKYFVRTTERKSIASVTTVKFKAKEPEKTTTDELDETTTEEPDETTTEELDETTTEELDETTTEELDETTTEELDETTTEEPDETTTEEQKPVISSEDMEIIVFNEGFMDIVSPSPIVPNNKETTSTYKPTNKANDKATKKATKKTTNKATKKATNKPTNKATNKATDKTTNKATNKATDKTTNKATDKTTSKATDKVTGFTEKGEIKSKRFRIATNKKTRTNADADANFRAGADMSTEDKKPKNKAFDLPAFF